MSSPTKIVLILCGTFNPITNSHLRLLEIARDHLSLNHRMEIVGGIISPVSDHYCKSNLQPWKHRCEMIQLALKPLNGVKHWVDLSDWEGLQNNWTTTLNVLKYHQQLINDTYKEEVQLKAVVGADLFETFNVEGLWKDSDIESLVRDFGLIIITRDGNDPWKTLNETAKSKILKNYKNNIHIVEEKIKNNISSTLIRQFIAAKLSIRYLIDDNVIEYIQNNRLYQ